MSKNNGHLSVNPNQAKCPPNVGKPPTRSQHQPTYIIIYKQKESDETGNVVPMETENTSNDIVRRNLADIDVDNYDSSFSTAKIFLGDEENDLQPKSLVYSQSNKPFEDVSETNVIKLNLFESSISSAPNSSVFTSTKIAPVVTPGNKNEQDSGVFCTPTSCESLKSHSAVRKIVLISPNNQTQLRVQSLAAHTLQASTSSPQFSPGFSIHSLPLASSTPVTATGHLDLTNTPDSAISLTNSFVCSTPDTPMTPSIVNLSTGSTSSVSSGFGRLQVSERLLDNSNNEFQITQTDLRSINIPVSTNEAEEQEDKCLDTSLANIQWLKGYSLSKKKQETESATMQRIRWLPDNPVRSEAVDIKKEDHESGHHQRPPYSYMTLIQMALNSRDDKKMTLKEICSWVETTFPFYMYTAKAGWKNSIRHNLSFYQCFVRDQAEKKKHGAHWTLQFDEPEQSTDHKSQEMFIPQSLTASEVPGMIPLFVNSPILQQSNTCLQPIQSDLCNSRKRRTGPMPILPRPSPMQAYALVPIQSVPLQAMQNNPIIVHVPNTLPQQQDMSNHMPIMNSVHTDTHTQSLTLASTVNSVHANSITQATAQLNSVYTQSKNMAMITVTPKQYSIETSTTNYSKIQLSSMPLLNPDELPGQSDGNVIKQAWLQAEDLCVKNNPPFFHTSPPVSSCELLSGNDDEAVKQGTKRQKTNSGLPKPKMYISHPKKKTRSRIKKQLPKVFEEKELLADSSDSESENKIYNELPTPLKLLFDTDNSEPHVTSTPLRNVAFSLDQLPSPIRGLTPLKCGNLFDGSFLDNLHEEATRTIKLFGSPISCESHKTGNNSFTEYGIVQISPDRGLKGQSDGDNKHNLSNLLADFPIDANFMDDGDGLPVDFSVLNWSSLQPQSLNLQPQSLNKTSPSDS